MQYWIFYILSVIVAAFAQIFLKKAAIREYKNFIMQYLNSYVIIGYIMMLGATIFTILAYQGIAYKNGPVIESLGYILVMLSGYFFFKEPITKNKVLGNILILLGIFVFYL